MPECLLYGGANVNIGAIQNQRHQPFILDQAKRAHAFNRIGSPTDDGHADIRSRGEHSAKIAEHGAAFKFILNVDGLTLGAVIVLSAASLQLSLSFQWTLVIGIILICSGIGVKLAAYRIVGAKGYYWYNFFCGDEERLYAARGVYRYLDNPMYTLGYLHAFGFALAFRSLWGLVFAFFDLAVIWAFHFCFESPHTTLHREREMSLRFPTVSAQKRPLARPVCWTVRFELNLVGVMDWW